MKKFRRLALALLVVGLFSTGLSGTADAWQWVDTEDNYYQTFTAYDGSVHCRMGHGTIENKLGGKWILWLDGATFARRDYLCANPDTVSAGTLAVKVTLYRYPNYKCPGGSTGWKFSKGTGTSWGTVLGGTEGNVGHLPGLIRPGDPDFWINYPGYDVWDCGGYGWYYGHIEHLSEGWGYGEEWTGAIEMGICCFYNTPYIPGETQ